MTGIVVSGEDLKFAHAGFYCSFPDEKISPNILIFTEIGLNMRMRLTMKQKMTLGLLVAIFIIFPLWAPAQNAAVPLEIDDHKAQSQTEPKVPLIVINLNINIGHNDVSTIAPTASYGKKAKVEKIKIHILRLQHKHDFFRALIQNEDGTNEWKDIQIDGLKYLSDDDVAWHYREYDVFSDGKIVSKERVLSVHKASFEAVINSPDGASYP